MINKFMTGAVHFYISTFLHFYISTFLQRFLTNIFMLTVVVILDSPHSHERRGDSSSLSSEAYPISCPYAMHSALLNCSAWTRVVRLSSSYCGASHAWCDSSLCPQFWTLSLLQGYLQLPLSPPLLGNFLQSLSSRSLMYF